MKLEFRLVGSAELQHLFGVSRKRVYQITQKDGFPEPVAVLTMGSIWALPDVEDYAAQTGRTLQPLPPLDAPPAAGVT